MAARGVRAAARLAASCAISSQDRVTTLPRLRTVGMGVAKAQSERPDLILMDIQLSILDGYEATRQIKANPNLKATPIIAISSFAMKGDEDKIRQGGCEDYISKPISISDFMEVVQKYLDQAVLVG